MASLRARTLIPRVSPARSVSRVGAPAAATPSHGAKKWGRPNRNKVLLAAKTRVVLLNDDTISQSSGPGPILCGSLDRLPSGGGEGGVSVDLSADVNPPTSSRVVILPEASEAATAEGVVSLAVTVQLPPSPIRELPSPTSPAAPTLTGWGSVNEEADERTGFPPSDSGEQAGDCNSADDNEEGSWTLVGKARVRTDSGEQAGDCNSEEDDGEGC